MKINKKTILIYTVYLFLIAFILTLFFKLKTTTTNILKDINIITPYLENENWEKSKELFDNFTNNYKKPLENLSIMIKDTEIRDVLLIMTDIHTNIGFKNKTSVLLNIENLKFYINNLYKSQIPTVLNIF